MKKIPIQIDLVHSYSYCVLRNASPASAAASFNCARKRQITHAIGICQDHWDISSTVLTVLPCTYYAIYIFLYSEMHFFSAELLWQWLSCSTTGGHAAYLEHCLLVRSHSLPLHYIWRTMTSCGGPAESCLHLSALCR